MVVVRSGCLVFGWPSLTAPPPPLGAVLEQDAGEYETGSGGRGVQAAEDRLALAPASEYQETVGYVAKLKGMYG